MRSISIIAAAITVLLFAGCENLADSGLQNNSLPELQDFADLGNSISGIPLPDSLNSVGKAAVPQLTDFIVTTGDKVVAKASTLSNGDTLTLNIQGNTVTGTISNIEDAANTAAATTRFISPITLQAAAASSIRYTITLSFSGNIGGISTVTIYDDSTWKIDGSLTFRVKDEQGADADVNVNFDQTILNGKGEISSGEVTVDDSTIDNSYGTAMTQFTRFMAVLNARMQEDEETKYDYLQSKSVKLRISTNKGYSKTHQFTNSEYSIDPILNEAIQSLGSSGTGSMDIVSTEFSYIIHESEKYKLAYRYGYQDDITATVSNGEIDQETVVTESIYSLGDTGTVYNVGTIGDITVVLNITGKYANDIRYWNGSITVNGVQIAIDNMVLTKELEDFL